jgi:hypothetical protein
MADAQDGTGAQRRWDEVTTDNKKVYSGFLGISKWAILLIVLVLVGMAIFLV